MSNVDILAGLDFEPGPVVCGTCEVEPAMYRVRLYCGCAWLLCLRCRKSLKSQLCTAEELVSARGSGLAFFDCGDCAGRMWGWPIDLDVPL